MQKEGKGKKKSVEKSSVFHSLSNGAEWEYDCWPVKFYRLLSLIDFISTVLYFILDSADWHIVVGQTE